MQSAGAHLATRSKGRPCSLNFHASYILALSSMVYLPDVNTDCVSGRTGYGRNVLTVE